MNGWRLAVVLVAAFGLGYLIRWWVCMMRCTERHIRMYRRVLVAEANQNHALCQVTETTMANIIVDQKARLDAYAAASELGDEIEQHLRERGGP